MRIAIIIAIVACVIVGLFLFLRFKPSTKSLGPIVDACIQKCQEALNSGQDLSSGPCLGNPLENYTDWVCDVAHSPRQAIDNNPENQCSAYRQGLARHFIEVTPDCKLIRVV